MHPTFLAIRDKLREDSALGSRVLSNGVELIGHVPEVAPEAYRHILYPGLDEAGIRVLEEQLGQKIPVDYAEFLRCSNGLHAYLGFSLYGLRKDFSRVGDEARQPFSILTPNLDERPRGAQSGFLFFGSYSSNGDLLYLDAETNGVHRCRSRSAKSLEAWPDFWTMLESEVERLAREFDVEKYRLF